MPATLIVEWTFTPPELFEDRLETECDGCAFVIEAGKVTGNAPTDPQADAEQLRRACTEFHQRLDALFLGAQVFAHAQYTLSEPGSIRRVHPDGRQDAFVFAGFGVITISMGSVDVQVTDAHGNAIVDTRKARIASRLALAKQAAAHTDDPTANAILRSYSAAVVDPRNELVHLYEIREALSTRFGGEQPTHDALGTSATKWSTLGRLADREPLLQGRHRGQHPGALRAATSEELAEARRIAREMIERYLSYLEAAKP